MNNVHDALRVGGASPAIGAGDREHYTVLSIHAPTKQVLFANPLGAAHLPQHLYHVMQDQDNSWLYKVINS